MSKALTSTTAFLGLASLGFAAYITYERSQLPVRWKDLVPLNVPLVNQGNDIFQVNFKSGFSETHYLGIYFTNQPPNAGASSPAQQGALLGRDLQWKLLDGPRLIAGGHGQQSTGQTVHLGFVELKARHSYKLVTTIGPEFKNLLASGPIIEVGVKDPTVSIGLAVTRDLGHRVSICFGIVGAILFVISIGSMWVHKRSSSKNHV